MALKDMRDATQFVGKSLLPKEFGGDKFTDVEMMEKFEENLPLLIKTNKYELDTAPRSF